MRPRVWCSRVVSDWLVQIQDQLAQYPSWAVAGAIGFVVVVAVILIWKALRIALVALVVAIIVAGGWYVWENVLGHGRESAPSHAAPTGGGRL